MRFTMKNIYNKVMNTVEIEEQIQVLEEQESVELYEEHDLCEVLDMVG
jgi:hypothetical protein